MQSLENSGKHTMLDGPWGGQDGFYWDDGVYSTVRQLEIAHGAGIDSIKIEYDMKGKSVWSQKHGGSGGSKVDKVRLEYPDEYLTSMHGHYGSLHERGLSIIRSLTFETNKRTYGPFGVQQGTYFAPKMHGKIVGFVGKSGWYLDSIGVYVEPLLLHKPIKNDSIYHSYQNVAHGTHEKYEYSMIQGSLGKNYDLIVAVRQKDNSIDTNTSPPINLFGQISHTGPKNEVIIMAIFLTIYLHIYVVQRMVKNPAPYGTGPWGGEGGKPWDDGVFTGIKQIILTKTDAICCIEIEYDRNGQSVWSVKHGGSGGQTANRVKLEYPNEVLTCISGYYGPIKKDHGTRVIQSLTFHTSRRKYGPFGEEIGTYFTSGTTEGKVVGFHGRSSVYLDAIGVHMQHWLGNQKQSKHGSLMKMFS
ncbi:hypothetical protein DH2020_008065 [Rehmannia glutinosa]|uniref:Jacalin-type lectin domain-containing protein n=1 Tax=Rehmannia glutinosa TaxID=99300 RepID=A0ABR0U0T0_REHGL